MNFAQRFAAFAALTVIPFLRFLVESRFSLLRSESLAAAALFCIPALVFACLGRRVHVPLLIGCTLIVATDSFRQQLSPLAALGPLVVAGLLLAVLGGAAALLRTRFSQIVILFSLTFFAGEFLRAPQPTVAAGRQHQPRARGHVLYLILDGHIGIAGFPVTIPACAQARDAVSRTLDAHDFTTYTNATSNYGVTLLSIPSILNQQLLTTPDEFTHDHTAGGATIISPNGLFADYASRGYKVVVYQHRSIDYADGSPNVDRRIDYSSEISGLEFVPNWGRRVLWLVGDYQGSAPLLSSARGFLPFRAGFHRTGALAIRSIWPGPLAADIEQSEEKSLFFVHLLAPHEPYVYRADGSVRDLSEWTSDTPVPPLPAATYQTRFAAYCEQVSALSKQLNAFLEQLRAAGVLDSMTVVIHGDHGSRIYLKGADNHSQLMNEFSALLAIKSPGERVPVTNRETASVMNLLARDFRGRIGAAAPHTNSLFWLDEKGFPAETPIQQFWR